MKCETFVQFLQEFWVRHSCKNYTAVTNLLIENNKWVLWLKHYAGDYMVSGEHHEARFEGAYDIETVTEAWLIAEMLLTAFNVGYNQGWQNCWRLTN